MSKKNKRLILAFLAGGLFMFGIENLNKYLLGMERYFDMLNLTWVPTGVGIGISLAIIISSTLVFVWLTKGNK